uniref:Phospholipase A and acyltransferase 1-like n=1 Tax=Salmo trutta TaxID=8032 RepID=A0A673ZXF9_SALTR
MQNMTVILLRYQIIYACISQFLSKVCVCDWSFKAHRRETPTPMGLGSSHPKPFPGDILEFPLNKYFSHFGIYYGERDGVPYVAHLTCRDSETKLLLFGRALKSEVKLDPVELVGRRYKVRNLLDEVHPPRDFYSLVKPAIDDMIGRDVTFDILFHNSEHQATLFRYGLKKSTQIEKVYAQILPTWKKPFEKKKL